MAERDPHLEQARGNRDFLLEVLATSESNPFAMQWVVTAAFYCAVHCMEAHLALNLRHSRSHDDRENLLVEPEHGVSREVFTAYKSLKRWSMGARYFLGHFSGGRVRAEVLPRLAIVCEFVGLDSDRAQ